MIKFYFQVMLFFAAGCLSQPLFALPPGKAATLVQPVLLSFNPARAKTGDVVTITGHHFTGATQVVFGNTNARSFAVVSDSVMTAVVDTGSSGNIYVYNGPGAYGALGAFTYIPAYPAPIVTSFSPDTATIGTVITVHGANFTHTTAVLFGPPGNFAGASSWKLVSDSLLTAVVATVSTQQAVVLVADDAGTGSMGWLTTVPPVVPVINSFSPASVAAGGTVTIRGSHFIQHGASVTAVSFGGWPARSFATLSDSIVTAVVDTGSTGAVKITGGYGSASLAGFSILPYQDPHAPVITSFSPDSATTGTTITIRGRNLAAVDTVFFGAGADFYSTEISDTLITAVVGLGASGSVTVYSPNGQASLPGFIYYTSASSVAPVITSCSPDTAAIGSTVTLHGLHFTGVHIVFIGNANATSFTVVSDNIITTVVPAGSSTGRVAVYGPGGVGLLDYIDIYTAPIPKQAMALYPNPAVSALQTVTVPGTTQSGSRFELTDMNGTVLQVIPVSPKVSQVQINTSRLHKGVYKLVWTDGKNYSHQTILIL